MGILASMLPLVRSPEDLATQGLQFVLSSSDRARQAFNGLVGLPEGTGWAAQHVLAGEDETGRPDLAGYLSGDVRGFVEAKFEAGFTAAQPVEYLRALPDGGRLIALVPQSRANYLTAELLRRCTDHGFSIDPEGGEYTVSDGDQAWGLLVITWDAAIGHLLRATDRPDQRDAHDDLAQLRCVVDALQRRLWTPVAAEDLSARRVPHLNLQVVSLVLDLPDRLIVEGFESRGRALSWISGSVAVQIGLPHRQLAYIVRSDWQLWRDDAATPLYLAIHWDVRRQFDHLIAPWLHEHPPRAVMAQHWNTPGLAIPLHIPPDADRSAVLDDLAAQVSQHVRDIEALTAQ